MGNYRVISSPMSGVITLFTTGFWGPLLWKKDVWRPCFPLVVRWDLRICRALLLGCPSDLGNAWGGVFCYQCFFFTSFWRAVSDLSDSARNLESGGNVFLSLKIATLFSITYPYLLGNQFYNTQTAVSLEPTCGVLFISWGKQTLNMAWTLRVSEWWSQSFSDIFFLGKSNWMHLGMSIFSDHGNHVRVQWATCFYSNVVTFGTHLKRISWLVNLHLPGHVTPYWNKV